RNRNTRSILNRILTSERTIIHLSLGAFFDCIVRAALSSPPRTRHPAPHFKRKPIVTIIQYLLWRNACHVRFDQFSCWFGRGYGNGVLALVACSHYPPRERSVGLFFRTVQNRNAW